MRSVAGLVAGRLFGLSMALFIALSAGFSVGAGSALAPDHVPMPPGDFKLDGSDPHFDIYYDSIRISDVGDVIIDANDAYNKVTSFYGPFNYRVKIILASDHSQYSNILTLSVPEAGEVPGGDIASAWGDGARGTIVIESPDQLSNFREVLAYQLSLIVMRTQLIDNKYAMPQWFSSGLASYVSGNVSGKDRAAVERSCLDNKAMTVAQMESLLDRSSDPSTSADEVSLARARSGMLIEFIATKYGNESIRLIMQDYAPTGDLDKAFTRRIGYSPENVNADWASTLKGQVNMRDGLVLSQRVYGYVLDANGDPVANETIVFTCLRNDTAVYGKNYTAMTNGTGYYKVDLTYGLFSIHLDRAGFRDPDGNITLQKNELRPYNVTLAKAGSHEQNFLASPQVAGDQTVYALLGIVNAAAVLLIAFVFWRTRK